MIRLRNILVAILCIIITGCTNHQYPYKYNGIYIPEKIIWDSSKVNSENLNRKYMYIFSSFFKTIKINKDHVCCFSSTQNKDNLDDTLVFEGEPNVTVKDYIALYKSSFIVIRSNEKLILFFYLILQIRFCIITKDL